MPVEIRELVIQARVQDEAGTTSNTAQRQHDPTADPGGIEAEVMDNNIPLDHESIERIVDRCLARVKEWFAEQAIR